MNRILTLAIVGLFATAAYGQMNTSLYFDGIDDYVEVTGSSISGLGNGDFTIEAWVKGKEAEQPLNPMILSNRQLNTDQGLALFFRDTWGGSKYKMLCLSFRGENYQLINNGNYDGSVLNGTCRHIAVSRKNDTLRFYLDGLVIGEQYLRNPGSIYSTRPMWIGKDFSTTNVFKGNIADVKIWDYARSDAQIASNKDAIYNGSEPGLFGYWDMADFNSQVVVDKTRNNDAVLGGTIGDDSEDPKYVANVCDEADTVSFEFDGVNDYVKVSGDALVDVKEDNFTVEAWIKGVESEQNQHPMILSNRYSNINKGVMLFIHDLWGGSSYKMLSLGYGGRLYLVRNNGSYNGSILDGQCHHVAARKQGNYVELFVDGSSIGRLNVSTSGAIYQPGGNLFIGKDYPTGNEFKGVISEVRIWNTARTDVEIASAMNTSVSATSDGLKGYWKMNLSLQDVTDITGNNHGVLGAGMSEDFSDPKLISPVCELDTQNVGMMERNIEDIMLFPNPGKGKYQFKYVPESARARYVVYDSNSRVVYESGMSAVQTLYKVDISTEPEGVYMLKVFDKDKVISQSIMLVK